MAGLYGSEWAVEEKVKRREMVASEACYIFVYWNANEMMDNAFTPLLGFLHFRFTLEEEIPVLYLYELQLDTSVQGKGLGKFLMQLVDLIAQEVSILIFFLMSLNLLFVPFSLCFVEFRIMFAIECCFILYQAKFEVLRSDSLLCFAFHLSLRIGWVLWC